MGSGAPNGEEAMRMLASTIREDLEQHQLAIKELVESIRLDMQRHTEEVKGLVAAAKLDLEGQIEGLRTSVTEQVKLTGDAVKVDVKKEMSRVMHSQIRYVSNELSNYKPSK